MTVSAVCPACAATYGGVIDSDCPLCAGYGVVDVSDDVRDAVGARAAARAVEMFMGAAGRVDIGRHDERRQRIRERAARAWTVGLLTRPEGAPLENDHAWQPDPGEHSAARSVAGRKAGKLLVQLGLWPARPRRGLSPSRDHPDEVARAVANAAYVPPRTAVPPGVADLSARRLRRGR